MADFGKGDLASVFGAEATEEAVKLKNDKRDEVPGFKPKLNPAQKTVRYRAGQMPAFLATSTPEVTASALPLRANSASLVAMADPAGAAVVEEYESDEGAIEAYESDSQTPPRQASAAAAPVAAESDSDSEAEAAVLAAARARARARANAAASIVPSEQGDSCAGDLVAQALQQSAPAARVTVVHSAPGSGSDSDASVHRPMQSSAQGSDQHSDDASSSQSDSDSDSSSEEEGGAGGDDWLMAARPVFVPAAARTTIKTQEQLDKEAATEAAEAEKQRAARREAAQEAVATVVLAEEEAAAAAAAGSGDEDMPSDGDHSSEEEADFAAWKLRELKRQQRDLQAAQAAQAELAATLARRNMTDAERAEDDKRLEAAGVKVFSKAKRSRGFMQKHYHKGAFYMDEDSIKDKDDVRLRVDADAATGADKVDKKILPKAMQVRDFGKRGQSKWTHLAAEDTTFAAQTRHTANAVSSDLTAAPRQEDASGKGAAGMWFKGGSSVVDSVMSRMAGAGSDINAAGRIRRRDGSSTDAHTGRYSSTHARAASPSRREERPRHWRGRDDTSGRRRAHHSDSTHEHDGDTGERYVRHSSSDRYGRGDRASAAGAEHRERGHSYRPEGRRSRSPHRDYRDKQQPQRQSAPASAGSGRGSRWGDRR